MNPTSDTSMVTTVPAAPLQVQQLAVVARQVAAAAWHQQVSMPVLEQLDRVLHQFIPIPRSPQHPDNPVDNCPLTTRQREVLQEVADGKSNAQIGQSLFITEDSVKTHLQRIFHLLDVRTRAAAVSQGFRIGIVS